MTKWAHRRGPYPQGDPGPGRPPKSQPIELLPLRYASWAAHSVVGDSWCRHLNAREVPGDGNRGTSQGQGSTIRYPIPDPDRRRTQQVRGDRDRFARLSAIECTRSDDGHGPIHLILISRRLGWSGSRAWLDWALSANREAGRGWHGRSVAC